MVEQPSIPQVEGKRSRRRWVKAVIVIAVFIFGSVIAWRSPVWLSPPFIKITSSIYIAIALAWIPLWVLFYGPSFRLPVLVLFLPSALLILFLAGWRSPLDCKQKIVNTATTFYWCSFTPGPDNLFSGYFEKTHDSLFMYDVAVVRIEDILCDQNQKSQGQCNMVTVNNLFLEKAPGFSKN